MYSLNEIRNYKGITNGIVETHMLIETHPYMHEVYEKYTLICPISDNFIILKNNFAEIRQN